MSPKSLEEVGLALAEGYPSPDTDSTRKELARVVEVALPSLAFRASSALSQGKEEVEEVWKTIRQDSEELFAPALPEVERVKVIYVASKFANNKQIGELMTRLAIDLARSQKED
jgi:hypothetical protein